MDHLATARYLGRMKRVFTNLDEVFGHGCDTVIDVRSPAEYAEDHWPGAINLPVLTNAQRAEVGTIYKKISSFNARVLGASYVTANASTHLKTALADKPGGWQPLVYCWRGGQRSGFFASLLEQVGWRVTLVDGGYRSYRRLVVAGLHDTPLSHRFILIDGNTGTAKTDVLGILQDMGEQVLDLEGLANHRGSVFGARPGGQPSQKAFESALAAQLHALDPNRPVYVEAESNRIGQLYVPPSIWQAMCVAPRIEISAPLQARAEYLRAAYDDIFANGPELERILNQLVRLQGHERVNRWLDLAKTGQFVALNVELMRDHYDPRYIKSRNRLDVEVQGIEVPDLSSKTLKDLARTIQATTFKSSSS